ncbi:MAG: hypothetical protein NHB15_15810 [Methanosarcina barkeri]|nr:hypothetical protein [Methanosarcina sp. ERenArc_MAG2]
MKNYEKENNNLENSGTKSNFRNENDLLFILTVADNGQGFPEEVDFQNTKSLGLQIVNILVEQIEGYIELKRDNGTAFCICFSKLN